MSTEENKAKARRWIEMFSTGDLSIADEITGAEWTLHDPSTPGEWTGPEGHKQVVSLYRTAFPDLKLVVEDQVAEADRVVTRWTSSGTQLGNMPGLPATGKQSRSQGITIDRFDNGKLAETWVVWDTLGAMQQLGAIPAPAEA